jgi:hypothetical protein
MSGVSTRNATEEMAPEPTVDKCTCCGSRVVGEHVRLYCHPEITICDRCLFWLNSRRLHMAGGRLLRRLQKIATFRQTDETA